MGPERKGGDPEVPARQGRPIRCFGQGTVNIAPPYLLQTAFVLEGINSARRSSFRRTLFVLNNRVGPPFLPRYEVYWM